MDVDVLESFLFLLVDTIYKGVEFHLPRLGIFLIF